jgi:SAM-dependent methyltransferase
MSENKEYILGTNQTELDRLGFQHKVWKKITDSFFDRINIRKGWKCLDVGAGPGFVSMDLIERVGESGEVTALEPSELYLDYFKDQCAKKNIKNVKFILGKLEESDPENDHYDMIFLRWVIDFVPEPEKFLLKLLSALKKGGVIAIEDYNYQGIALFPKGGAFDNITETVRNYWRAGGGDPYFISKIPLIFKKNNIELLDFSPQSLAGDSDSDIYEWANRFFSVHLQIMADMKVISQTEADEMLDDWKAHKDNPSTVFFSPVLVDVLGRKK